MAQAIATSIETVELEQSQAAANPLATIWMVFLGACLGGTLLCTGVLVAWPILAKMFGGA